MEDKSLGILLMVLFAMSGIAILMLAWLRPVPESERMLTTVIGSTGIFMALMRALLLKSPRARTGSEQVPVEAEIKDKP